MAIWAEVTDIAVAVAVAVGLVEIPLTSDVLLTESSPYLWSTGARRSTKSG